MEWGLNSKLKIMLMQLFSESDNARDTVQHIEHIPYGTKPSETLDIFVPDSLPKGEVHRHRNDFGSDKI